MSPRHKSVDSSDSSGSEDYKYKDKEKKKDKDHKEKKDKDKDKDKKDKSKDKKDKDKDKDKSKDKSKDEKDKHKDIKSKEGKVEHSMTPGSGQAAEYYNQSSGQPGSGAFTSPPIVPPSFEANRTAAQAPAFPNAPSFPSAAPGFPTPPPYDSPQATNNAPPSGYRLPLTSTSAFPDPATLGQPPCYEADGVTPIYIGSALFDNSVHPCKIGAHLQPFASVAFGGSEHGHHGRFDVLPFVPATMEWVRTSYGRIPPGRRPIEGGYEENGTKLYHGLAVVNGIRVPGKTGEHLGACNVSFGGAEVAVTDHDILCWK